MQMLSFSPVIGGDFSMTSDCRQSLQKAELVSSMTTLELPQYIHCFSMSCPCLPLHLVRCYVTMILWLSLLNSASHTLRSHWVGKDVLRLFPKIFLYFSCLSSTPREQASDSLFNRMAKPEWLVRRLHIRDKLLYLPAVSPRWLKKVWGNFSN